MGIDDKDYSEVGVQFVKDESEILKNSDIIIQLGILSDDKISVINGKSNFDRSFKSLYENKDKLKNLSEKK